MTKSMMMIARTMLVKKRIMAKPSFLHSRSIQAVTSSPGMLLQRRTRLRLNSMMMMMIMVMMMMIIMIIMMMMMVMKPNQNSIKPGVMLLRRRTTTFMLLRRRTTTVVMLRRRTRTKLLLHQYHIH